MSPSMVGPTFGSQTSEKMASAVFTRSPKAFAFRRWWFTPVWMTG